MRAGMPTVQAGKKLAQKFRDIAWWAHERGRVAAEINPHQAYSWLLLKHDGVYGALRDHEAFSSDFPPVPN
jgi:hypothetical protein